MHHTYIIHASDYILFGHLFHGIIFETISHIIADKKEIEIKKKAMSEFSEKNTWENNNKLIIKTIYEN